MKPRSCFFILLFLKTVVSAQPAFPGAEGFGATTTGGRGGQVIRVTNLNCSGTGSLNHALQQPGAKYIVFTVSGVIDCGMEIIEGQATIAGQTSPGGIIVRGIIADDYYDSSANPDQVIMRHIRSRGVATHPPGGQGYDPIIISGVENFIADHCSFSNSDDEAVDISRSRELTIQNCLLAETLGPHAYLGGMLINYSSPGQVLDNLSIHHNCWNRLGGRMPELSCEDPTGCVGATVHLENSCNLLWDFPIQLWHNIDANPGQGGDQPWFLHANFHNNEAKARADYCGPMFLFDFLQTPQSEFFVSGNHLNTLPGEADYELFNCCNDFCQPGNHPNTDPGQATHRATRHPFPPITVTPGSSLRTYMGANVGAFPRFPHENRLMGFVAANTIDPTPIDEAGADDVLTFPGGAPPVYPNDTDLDGMPDYWETAHGLNPNVQDHNGTGLSVPITGVTGYTNLECYLNCLSDALVSGTSGPPCSIQGYGILAVELVDFQAFVENETAVRLRWEVASSINCRDFDIERSPDPVGISSFEKIGSVACPAGPALLEFLDNSPRPGLNFYRLREQTFDGQAGQISPVRSVFLKKLNVADLVVFPNPAADELVLTFKNESAADWVGLRDLAGRLVREQSEPGRSLRFSTENLTAGLYLLDLRTRNGERVILKVAVR